MTVIERAISLREAQTKIVANLVKHAHREHIIGVESMILRYRADLLQALQAQRHHIVAAADDQHELGVVLNNLTQHMQQLAHKYVPQACDLGCARALRDLQTRGWVGKIKGKPKAEKMAADSILTENIMYLQHALMPAMHAALYTHADADVKIAAMQARIASYSHYLWKSAERTYILTMREAFMKIKISTKPRKLKLVTRESNKLLLVTRMREGGEGSGNFGHAGVAGQVGGSASSGKARKELHTCPKCNGSGKVSLRVSKGHDNERCWQCAGSGKIVVKIKSDAAIARAQAKADAAQKIKDDRLAIRYKAEDERMEAFAVDYPEHAMKLAAMPRGDNVFGGAFAMMAGNAIASGRVSGADAAQAVDDALTNYDAFVRTH